MKAKEYFEKYDRLIVEEYPETKHLTDFLIELMREVEKLIDERKCKKADAGVSVIKEVNQKYNAVVALYEKKYGKSPLVRNGFLDVCRTNMPFLKDYI